MTARQIILKSQLSRANVTLTEEQSLAVETAMSEFAQMQIMKYRDNQAKENNKEAIKLLPSIVSGQLRLWLRNWYFKKAKKQAQIRADTENRKCYVIRKSEIAYVILSTRDVDMNKRMKILGNSIGAKELTANADYVVYPQGYKKPTYVKKLK